jgi:hypothetical protein
MAVQALMFVWLRGRETWLDGDRRRQLSYLLASTNSSDDFIIPARLPGASADDGHVLELCERDEQGRPIWTLGDPELTGEPDDQFVNVNLRALYYDETYPRGDWPRIRWVSEWLDRRFPGGTVYYGGDGSSKHMLPMTPERREAINSYFLEHGHRDYLRHLGSGFASRRIRPPVCDVCGVEPWASGGAIASRPEAVYYTCDGCGQQWVATRKETRAVPHGRTAGDFAEEMLGRR